MSSWWRSCPSLGLPAYGEEWRKQSINGPWKRSVFVVCRSLRYLFEDRFRPVSVSTETNRPVRSFRSVYDVCQRPVHNGLYAKPHELSGPMASITLCCSFCFVAFERLKGSQRCRSWSGRARSKRRAKSRRRRTSFCATGRRSWSE